MVISEGVDVIEGEVKEMGDGGRLASKSKAKSCSSATISGGGGCSVTSAPANASSGKMLRSMGKDPRNSKTTHDICRGTSFDPCFTCKFRQIIFSKKLVGVCQMEIFRSTVKPVLSDHAWAKKKCMVFE